MVIIFFNNVKYSNVIQVIMYKRLGITTVRQQYTKCYESNAINTGNDVSLICYKVQTRTSIDLDYQHAHQDSCADQSVPI